MNQEFKLIAPRNLLGDKCKVFSLDDYPECRDGMVSVHERDSAVLDRGGEMRRSRVWTGHARNIPSGRDCDAQSLKFVVEVWFWNLFPELWVSMDGCGSCYLECGLG